MTPAGKLHAWIEGQSGGKVLARFVGVTVTPDGHVAVPGRAPATQICRSTEEARAWIEHEATALGLPVEWVEHAASAH